MPTVHHGRKEVLLKLVYYGPGLSGKTTNLERIHRRSKPEYRGKLLSLTTESERTIFFDLLPVHLGKFKGYSIRLHVCTVPGQIAYDETRKLILRNVDGLVFVVDSQMAVVESNVQSMANLEANLKLQNLMLSRIPLVVQYNKRDLETALPVDELRAALNLPRKVPETEAVARDGKGVFDTLKLIVKECLMLVGDPTRASEGRTPSILPGKRASRLPGARPLAARSPASVRYPAPPRLPRDLTGDEK